MIRKMDKLGRVVLPKEWRDHAGIGEEDEISMTFNEETKEFTIKKHTVKNVCAFCGNEDVENLFRYRDGIICRDCLKHFKGDR